MARERDLDSSAASETWPQMRERGCIDAWKYIKFESTPVKDPPPPSFKMHLIVLHIN